MNGDLFIEIAIQVVNAYLFFVIGHVTGEYRARKGGER